MARWSKCPTWWIRDNGFLNFTGGKGEGTSIAALKCLMALSMSADFYTLQAKVSLSDLEEITGLSRPLIVRGVHHLEESELIAVDRGEHTNRYTLVQETTDKGWTKLPVKQLKQGLPELPNRGGAALAALKIYLYLASIRPNMSTVVSAKYETIRDETHIQLKHVRAGLDLLVMHNLIKVNRADTIGQYRQHEYQILGLAV